MPGSGSVSTASAVGPCSDGDRVRVDLMDRGKARTGAVIGLDAGEIGFRQRGRIGASVNQRLLHMGETGVADLETFFHYLPLLKAPAPGAVGNLSLQRIWANDFPAVALEEFVAFVRVGRSMLRERLDITAGDGDWPGCRGTARGRFRGRCSSRHAVVSRRKPGSPAAMSSPILKVNSPASTQATSSLSQCR